jgi:hypothetical protein
MRNLTVGNHDRISHYFSRRAQSRAKHDANARLGRAEFGFEKSCSLGNLVVVTHEKSGETLALFYGPADLIVAIAVQ